MGTLHFYFKTLSSYNIWFYFSGVTLRGSTFVEYFKTLFFLLPSVHIQENLEDELVKEALEKVSQIR